MAQHLNADAPINQAVAVIDVVSFLPSNVKVPSPEELRDYLTAHADLGTLLNAICARCRETFGPETELSLELYKDPEVHDQYLTLYLRQDNYEPDIIDRIEAVTAEFANSPQDASGYLLVTTDFRRRRG